LISIGPKEPTDKELTVFSLKNSIVLEIVSSGVVVGIWFVFKMLKCSSPIARTNFVPPASIEP
jgi:hypothetical protein